MRFSFFCVSLALLFLGFSPLMAQANKPFKERSDPEAKKTLDKLSQKYKGMPSLQGEYVLTIEGGKRKEVQQGQMAQKGDKFRVQNAGNELICDGKTLWLYQKTGSAANTVQINDYDPNDEEMLSPSNLLNLYNKNNKFFYAVVNDDAVLQEIEFKPLDKKSEYAKIRIQVDKQQNMVKQVKVFGKDGMRYTLDIKKLVAANFPDTHFSFDKTKYPGVKVSDMRE